jgi:hypothetical protein
MVASLFVFLRYISGFIPLRDSEGARLPSPDSALVFGFNGFFQ